VIQAKQHVHEVNYPLIWLLAKHLWTQWHAERGMQLLILEVLFLLFHVEGNWVFCRFRSERWFGGMKVRGIVGGVDVLLIQVLISLFLFPFPFPFPCPCLI